VQITQFVKTLETQLYANVLQLIPAILILIADLIHAQNLHADKIQTVAQVDSDHCVDVLEDSLEIPTAGLDAVLTLALLIIHAEKELSAKIPEEGQYAHVLQAMQEILM